jgi:hypothetical protein
VGDKGIVPCIIQGRNWELGENPKEVSMTSKPPSTSDIIYALISIGFIAGEETPVATVLSNGNYTVKVPVELAHIHDFDKLREELDEIFTYYTIEVAELTEDMDSEDYDDNLNRVVSWAHQSVRF